MINSIKKWFQDVSLAHVNQFQIKEKTQRYSKNESTPARISLLNCNLRDQLHINSLKLARKVSTKVKIADRTSHRAPLPTICPAECFAPKTGSRTDGWRFQNNQTSQLWLPDEARRAKPPFPFLRKKMIGLNLGGSCRNWSSHVFFLAHFECSPGVDCPLRDFF